MWQKKQGWNEQHQITPQVASTGDIYNNAFALCHVHSG